MEDLKRMGARARKSLPEAIRQDADIDDSADNSDDALQESESALLPGSHTGSGEAL